MSTHLVELTLQFSFVLSAHGINTRSSIGVRKIFNRFPTYFGKGEKKKLKNLLYRIYIYLCIATFCIPVNLFLARKTTSEIPKKVKKIMHWLWLLFLYILTVPLLQETYEEDNRGTVDT